MSCRWVLPVLFLLLTPVYFLTLSSPAVGTFHDDGIYLVTAKALAEEGEYAISSLPDALPQTKYPVLFPLMLAGVWWLDPNFPANVLFLKLIPFTATIVWLLLAGLLLRRLGSSRMEAGTIVLFALASPWTLYLSTSLLSDIPFAMFVTGALFLLEADPDVGRGAELAAPFSDRSGFRTRLPGRYPGDHPVGGSRGCFSASQSLAIDHRGISGIRDLCSAVDSLASGPCCSLESGLLVLLETELPELAHIRRFVCKRGGPGCS